MLDRPASTRPGRRPTTAAGSSCRVRPDTLTRLGCSLGDLRRLWPLSLMTHSAAVPATGRVVATLLRSLAPLAPRSAPLWGLLTYPPAPAGVLHGRRALARASLRPVARSGRRSPGPVCREYAPLRYAPLARPPHPPGPTCGPYGWASLRWATACTHGLHSATPRLPRRPPGSCNSPVRARCGRPGLRYAPAPRGLLPNATEGTPACGRGQKRTPASRGAQKSRLPRVRGPSGIFAASGP